MVIQHNLTAMNSNRMLGITTSGQAKSSEKLSSGYKINRAADDAAGLSISEKMRKQMRGLDRASTNADDGISSVQTAEGALTEVHDMLQRMNELAVQAANGTNSESDRKSIQDEIRQLTTEIDRVAETTKFNETYLLKGGNGYFEKYMVAHDAGLNGVLADAGTYGTFTMDIKNDTNVKIAGKEYHIYKDDDKVSKIQDEIWEMFSAAGSKGAKGLSDKDKKVVIDGTEYEIKPSSSNASINIFKFGEEEFTVEEIKQKVVDGSKVSVKGGDTRTAALETLDKNIHISTAVTKVKNALLQANRVGVDSKNMNKVSVNINGSKSIDEETKKEITITNGTAGVSGTYVFSITKGTAQVAKDLGLSLHVGSDADMTNKISVNIQTMTAAHLGIQNLTVEDSTGIAATYAIDAIEDAIKQVSAQRSELGAIQNRLEHTIKNLDNVVENTTAAESRIRDTNMADEMVTYSKNNILAQAGQSMLAQANQSTQGVMSLLQG
ncbi:flagellin N-terminal helical domain-containing protein [Butyrivibrio sp. LC3010]|uniref:flagellin N-terminal helical domain-containing protein n=1 Tax=Butyrivibrio sp. LC3010 TaxID=1280680 RepID=UPI000417D4D8|nr:flagellin [Butyrivibrio sp. LC3010]